MKFAAITTAVFLSSLCLVGAADDGNKAGPPFFLIDTTDQLCLAGEEFKRCSIDTLWFVVATEGKIINSYHAEESSQSSWDGRWEVMIVLSWTDESKG